MKKFKWKKTISLARLISLNVMLVLSSSTFASDRPNILWIFADDLSALNLDESAFEGYDPGPRQYNVRLMD